MQPFFLYRSDTATPQRVDRYPDPPRAVTTVNIHSTGWTGIVEILASLSLNPGEEDWFVVHKQEVSGDEGKRQNFIVNLVGRFIWLNARVTQSGTRGRVDRITAI